MWIILALVIGFIIGWHWRGHIEARRRRRGPRNYYRDFIRIQARES